MTKWSDIVIILRLLSQQEARSKRPESEIMRESRLLEKQEGTPSIRISDY